MLNLQELAEDAIKQAETSGVFKDAINKALTEAVESEIKEAFGWSSDFRKTLKEAIKDKLHFDPS
ncbi:MAG: hypothetical protein JKX96_08335, partial [Acinetobacter sp.]|nr:hypothetical protein [Acinetobacter sp.]